MFGNTGVGKEALATRVADWVEYDATGTFTKKLLYKDTRVTLNNRDSISEEEFRPIRRALYRQVDGFILVYSITDRWSLMAAEETYHEACRYLGKTHIPAVLIGNKMDIRDDSSVTVAEGFAVAKKLGCRHVETSALSGENVDLAFEAIAIELMKSRQRRLAVAPQRQAAVRRCWVM
jgi:small GTP-binding protein